MTPSFSPEQGYWLRFSQEHSRFLHKTCGAHTIAGAECPNCQKPLLLVLSLDTADERLILDASPLNPLPLLYCWRCNLSQANFFYQINDAGVRVLKWRKGGVQADFPYKRYPMHFPETVLDVSPLTVREQSIIRAINHGDDELDDDEAEHLRHPAHQVGGEPICYNSDRGMKCVQCSATAPLLATIADNAAPRCSFTQNEYVQMMFFLCRKCWIVGAYQQCD